MTLQRFGISAVFSTLVAFGLMTGCAATDEGTAEEADLIDIEAAKPERAAILAIYGQPTDPAHFLDYYNSVHAVLADQLPGLINYHHGMVFGGNTTKFYEAVLTFGSQQALLDALASPQGQAAVNDLPNFASGGVDIILSGHEEQMTD